MINLSLTNAQAAKLEHLFGCLELLPSQAGDLMNSQLIGLTGDLDLASLRNKLAEGLDMALQEQRSLLNNYGIAEAVELVRDAVEASRKGQPIIVQSCQALNFSLDVYEAVQAGRLGDLKGLVDQYGATKGEGGYRFSDGSQALWAENETSLKIVEPNAGDRDA